MACRLQWIPAGRRLLRCSKGEMLQPPIVDEITEVNLWLYQISGLAGMYEIYCTDVCLCVVFAITASVKMMKVTKMLMMILIMIITQQQ